MCNNFEMNAPACYDCKTYRGKQYSLYKKDDISAAIKYLNAFQCYVGRFYNITVKPYRGKAWNPEKFVWIITG